MRRQYGWSYHHKPKTKWTAICFGTFLALIIVYTSLGVKYPIEPANDAQAKEQPTKTVVVEVETRNQRQIIEDKIIKASIEAGFDPEIALRIAQCESSMNQYAANKVSSAKGVFQFTDTTWNFIKASGHQFSVDESIHQFLIWYPIHKDWWICQ